MAKNKKIVIIFCVSLFVLVVGIFLSILIYNLRHPLTLTYNFDTASVVRIEIFDGTKGRRYTITDVTDVAHITTDIASKTYKRDNNVKGHAGFVYSTGFYDKAGNLVWSGTINGSQTLVDYHYVYRPNAPLDFPYIQQLVEEERYDAMRQS